MLNGIDKNLLNRIRYGGFLSDEAIEMFDNRPFGISNSESFRMDPSQRLLLTTSYEALIDAGYTINTVKDRLIGVFVAASGFLGNTYCSLVASKYELEMVDMNSILFAHSNIKNEIPMNKGFSAYDATSNALSVAAGRISYALGLRGVCTTTDTACSSSLVAIHYARKSLQNNESSECIVAGVNIIKLSESISFTLSGMTSRDGKCHTFDESANGYCRGEGCAAVVLKRMDDAIRDGNEIYAVIKGSAVMQDGKSASLTAPNGLAQQQLLQAALDDAGIQPSDVSYIEAHGTGTKLGDPIETEAIAAVFGKSRSAENPLYVSSVKANIGHLEAASGMAGLFSAILALHNRAAPANAELNVLNAKVSETVRDMNIVFPTELTAFDNHKDGNRYSLHAGVSSFGYSGTIAHVIIERSKICKRTLESEEKSLANSKICWQYSGQGTLRVGVFLDLFKNNKTYSDAMKKCDSILLNCIGYKASELLYPNQS
jgi:acyl transferase domain-containing protein